MYQCISVQAPTPQNTPQPSHGQPPNMVDAVFDGHLKRPGSVHMFVSAKGCDYAQSSLSRPLSLSLVGAARRAPRRTTPAVGADARHGLERRRWWRAAGWGGAARYGVGES